MKPLLLAAGAALLLTTAVTPAASGAPGTRTVVVVDTQFIDQPNRVLEASGPLATCTEVVDLEGDGVQIKPNTVLFFGVKEFRCGGEATVTVSYQATLNFTASDNRPGRTSGTWTIVDSTLDGVASGGGTLKGDGRCEPVAGADGCIIDTFRGHVTG
jgi:hypothetical protein